MKDALKSTLERLVESYGAERVFDTTRDVVQRKLVGNICTIVINEGIHVFPDYIIQGDKYVLYRGSLDFGDSEALRAEATQHLRELSIYLGRKKWSKIYTVISGHAAICMQVKLLVYRMTHLETVDWAFDGKGNYLRLHIPIREIISDSMVDVSE